MKEIYNNRFDDKKPFDVLRAEDFGGELYEFYEPLEKLIRRFSGVDIKGSRPVFLVGGRGTGKTMVLKYLSIEMQLKDFIKKKLKNNKLIWKLTKEELTLFFDLTKFIGIYLRFKPSDFSPIKNELKFLFLPYLAIKIAEQVFFFLEILKSSGLLELDLETKVIAYFLKQIKHPKINMIKDIESVKDVIKNMIIPDFEFIFNKVSFYSLDEIKNQISIPLINEKHIILGLPNFIFTELKFLNNKVLFILLDELEYLNEYQQNCIGMLLKDSDESFVIFKIGTRMMPENLKAGESNEKLREMHDYRKINISDALNASEIGGRMNYQKVIKNILNKRLENSKFFLERGITDIGQLFPNLSIEEEAKLLVKKRDKHWQKFTRSLKESYNAEDIASIVEILKYPKNPIIEKLNMLLFKRNYSPDHIRIMLSEYNAGRKDKYYHLYSKNALNLLFLLYSDYRTKKVYAGIDVFIHLSSGIIRNAIELCNDALSVSYNFGYVPEKNSPVKLEIQDKGSKHQARLQFDDIPTISKNLGMSVQKFILEVGSIFRRLHLNEDLVEPEPTHFETNYSEIKDTAKEIFDAALNYSYLQKKPAMAPKVRGETKKDDFIINRILAPYFNISYRVRGRTYISPSQITTLITGDNRQKRIVKSQILKNLNKNKKSEASRQKTLFDV